MEARAEHKYARISPRKVKIVCDLIRDKDAATASRAGCGFLRIDRSGRGSAGCLHSLDALCPAESSS